MSPPGQMATLAFGGTTSPTKNELIRVARLVLNDCGIPFSQNRIVRLVLRFQERAPRGSGHAFLLYLTNAVQMSIEQQRAALRNPDIARAISYSDPTGEQAVRNVLRGTS